MPAQPRTGPDHDTRPNIIWVFGDQHRGQALGYRGDPNLHTPNLDLLADEGVTFNAVGGCPLCCPFRGSLLSGLYPHKAVPGHQYQLDPDLPTVAHPFKDAGYHTAYFGKWHIDGWKEHQGRAAFHIIPPERRGGFDKWVGYENNNSQWDCWVHGGGEGTDEDAFHERLPGFETDGLTDLFINYLRTRAAKNKSAEGAQTEPFFGVLSVQPPHNPYVANEEWMARHTPARVELRPNVPDIPRVVETARRELAGYYAMIENLDWNVGRIRAALDELNLADNTYIMFFSDHGDMHGSHGMFKKTNPFEESLRVPCIIGGGRSHYGAGRGHSNIPFNHVDYAPTSLGLCGIDVPDWMQGTDLSGHRSRGREKKDVDSAFCQLVVPTGHGDSTDRAWRCVATTDGWKYAVLEGQPLALFNLNEDPYEQANLAFNSKYKAQRTKLQDRLAQWISDTGDEFTLPVH